MRKFLWNRRADGIGRATVLVTRTVHTCKPMDYLQSKCAGVNSPSKVLVHPGAAVHMRSGSQHSRTMHPRFDIGLVIGCFASKLHPRSDPTHIRHPFSTFSKAQTAPLRYGLCAISFSWCGKTRSGLAAIRKRRWKRPADGKSIALGGLLSTKVLAALHGKLRAPGKVKGRLLG